MTNFGRVTNFVRNLRPSRKQAVIAAAGLAGLASLFGNYKQYTTNVELKDDLSAIQDFSGKQATEIDTRNTQIVDLEKKLSDANKTIAQQQKEIDQYKQAAVQPPEVDYVDKVHKVVKGENLWKIAFDYYFRGPERLKLSQIANRTAEHNNLKPDHKFGEYSLIEVPVYYGEHGVKPYSVAVIPGDTLKSVVLRAISNHVVRLGYTNKVDVDNVAVVNGKLVRMKDGINDGYSDKRGYIMPGQELVIKDYKVKKSVSPQQKISMYQNGESQLEAVTGVSNNDLLRVAEVKPQPNISAINLDRLLAENQQFSSKSLNRDRLAEIGRTVSAWYS